MIKSIWLPLKGFSNICPDKEALTLKKKPFPLKSLDVEHEPECSYQSLRLIINLCINESSIFRTRLVIIRIWIHVILLVVCTYLFILFT